MSPILPLVLLACADSPTKAVAGELLIAQLDLSSGSIGESALVVGPDGTSVLVDVGNDLHRDAVADAVFAATGRASVDWIVLTHYHADHIGGFGGVAAERGVVWRGRVDLTDDTNLEELEPVEGDVTLCAETCEGWSAELGEGATLDVLVVNGWVNGEALDVGADENARSLGGTVRWGDFTYWFGGDLTGGGKDTPDMEGFLATRLDVGPVDVLHLHHHGIDSSSNDAWLDATLGEGDAHAIVGATGAYLAAPDDDVLDRVIPRLGAGKVWVTEDGMLAGSGAEVVHGDVVVRVRGDGGYTVNGEGFGG